MAEFDVNRKEHVVNLQGRKFVTFVGLQARLADQNKSIVGTEVEILKSPFDEGAENNQAVVRATVTIIGGKNAVTAKIQALGDASTLNVSKNIANATLRMAETRAIARALRIATRSPFTAVEEIGEEAA
jgi:hypothetical protein